MIFNLVFFLGGNGRLGWCKPESLHQECLESSGASRLDPGDPDDDGDGDGGDGDVGDGDDDAGGDDGGDAHDHDDLHQYVLPKSDDDLVLISVCVKKRKKKKTNNNQQWL